MPELLCRWRQILVLQQAPLRYLYSFCQFFPLGGHCIINDECSSFYSCIQARSERTDSGTDDIIKLRLRDQFIIPGIGIGLRKTRSCEVIVELMPDKPTPRISQRICRMRKQTEDNSQAAADNSTTPATEAAAEESTEAAGGTVESKGTITVAASATPHAEILAAAKPILAEQGWDLEVTEFDDYVLPNEVVESGEMDANYFQHVPYLDSFNEEKGTHLVEVGKIHYEPFGIYPGTKSSLDDIADGDVIAVPNDTTNEARALLLLQDNGIITLKDGAGLEATVNDIAENPYNVEIQELAAESVARVADEVAYVVLNGNYALQAGFSVAKDALAYEKSEF